MDTSSASPLSHPDAAFFRERGFGMRIGFGRQPVLLVVDLARGFTDPARPLGAELSSQIEATNRLLDACHERGIAVICSSVRYDDDRLADAGIWAIKQKGVASLAAAGDGPELDPRLRVEPLDAMLYKKYASCFFGTDLATRLVSAGADTLIITGTSTSGCVRATAVDACQHGFRPMVVREAVGDRAESAHAQSLFDLDAKYADVVSLEDTMQYLQGFKRV